MTHAATRIPNALAAILEAIDRIESYTAGMDMPGFLENEMAQAAVLRNVCVIGYAASDIIEHHPEFAAANPQLHLTDARQRSAALMERYYDVDLARVWRTILDELPPLYRDVQASRNRELGIGPR